MDPYIRLNIRPNFKQDTLPCDGKVGDLIILTPLAEDEIDSANDGSISLWLCIKASIPKEGIDAVWARAQFDGIGRCQRPVPLPPQDHRDLTRG